MRRVQRILPIRERSTETSPSQMLLGTNSSSYSRIDKSHRRSESTITDSRNTMATQNTIRSDAVHHRHRTAISYPNRRPSAHIFETIPDARKRPTDQARRNKKTTRTGPNRRIHIALVIPRRVGQEKGQNYAVLYRLSPPERRNGQRCIPTSPNRGNIRSTLRRNLLYEIRL